LDRIAASAVVIPAEHKRVYARLTTRYAALRAASEEPESSNPQPFRHSQCGGYWVPALHSRAKGALAWPGRQPRVAV